MIINDFSELSENLKLKNREFLQHWGNERCNRHGFGGCRVIFGNCTRHYGANCARGGIPCPKAWAHPRPMSAPCAWVNPADCVEDEIGKHLGLLPTKHAVFGRERESRRLCTLRRSSAKKTPFGTRLSRKRFPDGFWRGKYRLNCCSSNPMTIKVSI